MGSGVTFYLKPISGNKPSTIDRLAVGEHATHGGLDAATIKSSLLGALLH